MRLIDADKIVEVAEHAWDEWNLAMATQDTNRGVNKVIKMKELCKAVKAVADDCPAVDLGEVYDLDRLRELVKADRDGRIKIIPEYIGKACGSCGHFQRIAGTRRGTCEVKRCATSRRGTPWPDFPFEPSQSRTACKQWIGKGEKNEE